MPTFTAVALDRLIEPRAAKSMAAGQGTSNSKLEKRNGIPNPKPVRAMSIPSSKPEKRNSTTNIDKNCSWARISPALYATPESTPVPDSPSSFPPSPYIVNHKRRGPQLLKSCSEDDVAIRQPGLHGGKAAENAKNADEEVVDACNDVDFTISVPCSVAEDKNEEQFNGVRDEEYNCVPNNEASSSELDCGFAGGNGSMKFITFSAEHDVKVDDFFDPQDSLSVKSNTECENIGGIDRSLHLNMPTAEFYDAWEELSSESGPQLSPHDFEAEMREIRLSLLLEIEKRKQAEEASSILRSQWQRIQEQLSLAGLTLSVDPMEVGEDGEVCNPGEEIFQQIDNARFVSNSIGRGIAAAEAEVEMEARLKLKNIEIARLLDRLHYCKAVNQEMCQRNQESIEAMRRTRQRRKRRHRWIWGSVAAAITLGSATLAWSYLPNAKGSSSSGHSDTDRSTQ